MERDADWASPMSVCAPACVRVRTLLADAWGGNYFLIGGAVQGAQILGQYPDSFLETASVNIGRNHRLLPTSPWEAVWAGLAEWFGVKQERLAEVLPNMPNWPASQIMNRAALFHN